MQRETSNDSFLEYGQTYHESTSIRPPSPAAMYLSSIVLTVIHI